MVLVAKRFERRPIESRVGAFPDVFSSTDSRFKGTESRSEPMVRFRLATGEFGNYWCMLMPCLSSRKDKSDIISNQERAKWIWRIGYKPRAL